METTKKNYAERANDFYKLLIKKIKDDSDELCHSVWLRYRNQFLSLPKDDPKRQKIIDVTNEIQKEIKKGCSSQIKEYFKFLKVDPIILYRLFIETLDQIDMDYPVDIKKLND